MCALGYLSLVLHAHLPFVRHPEYKDMMEERWLFEAITETYIPLLEIFDKLLVDGVRFRLTMSITPPLANMLADDLLIERYSRHLSRLEELSEKEVERTRWQSDFHLTALMYSEKFKRARLMFNRWQGNFAKAFRYYQDAGVLEIITCCASHAFLPLITDFKPAVRAQIEMAVIDYEKYFKRKPNGIWLSECAYSPGDDEFLKQFGIKYFFVDTHGLLFAEPRPLYGVHAPVECPSGVFAFGRDVESGNQVWSSKTGYPGDPAYREFYRDIGYDLEYDYIKPYIHESGHRLETGIKYYRVTSPKTNEKSPYNYQNAMEKAAQHAAHFILCREAQIKRLAALMPRKPIIVSPYDAELFGHWWYEGPEFILQVLRKITLESSVINLETPSDYLNEYPTNQKCLPSLSSWGERGYNEVWLNERNAWIYPHLHKCTERMIELAEGFKQAEGVVLRALNQAARELMLLQASDWPFILKHQTTVEYASNRVKAHIFRFNKLYADLINGNVDERWLAEAERRDNIFSEIDYRIYQKNRLK